MEQYPDLNSQNSQQPQQQNGSLNTQQNPQFNGYQNNFNMNPYVQQNPYITPNMYQQNTGFNNYYNANMQQNQFQQNGNAFLLNQEKFNRIRQQKKEIAKYSTIIAIALLGFLFGATCISTFLEIFGLRSLYDTNVAFSSALGIFYSLLSIGLPFFLASKIIKPENKNSQNIYKTPKFNTKTVSIILFSVGGCIASLFFTNIASVFIESFGIYFTQMEIPEITSMKDVAAIIVKTVLVAPLVEEFAMRKVILQPLRKYGNTFAIIVSAILFGLFHGTPTQIPFAFFCGLFLAYAVIATESIWTGVIIHAIVNSFSCVYTAAEYLGGEQTAIMVYDFYIFGMLFIGTIFFFVYFSKYKMEATHIFNQKGLTDFTLGGKLRRFIFSPMMIITIIIFLAEAISLISTKSGVYT